MDASELKEAVARLERAHETREPIDPLVEAFPAATTEDAYRIQQELVRRWVDAGDPVRGHKVGLASAAMQRQMGVDQPDYGHLTGSMFHLEHQPIPTTRFLQPRIEPEVAFVLGAPLRGPGVTVADAVRAVDFVLPSLEIVDSRIKDWRIALVDTIADNASSGLFVLGARPRELVGLDLPGCAMTLRRGTEVVSTGSGAECMGDPLATVAWLATTAREYGRPLRAGEVVLSGALGPMVPVAPGDRFHAEIVGLGEVEARFTGGSA
jgi:2-keto-4-pentenoate hydratase